MQIGPVFLPKALITKVKASVFIQKRGEFLQNIQNHSPRILNSITRSVLFFLFILLFKQSQGLRFSRRP